jgi:DNA-directed RNA polymerase specialized sigma subunit
MAKEQLRRQTGRQATQQQIADLFGVTREYVGQELRKLTQGS